MAEKLDPKETVTYWEKAIFYQANITKHKVRINMFIDEIPSKKIGYLAPRHVIDNGPYEFYRLAPPGVMLVMVSCGLNEFTLEDVERVFKSLEHYLFTVSR